MKPHYSEQEANDILRRAIEQMPVKTEMSREQLVSIASEIGLSAEALQKAEADVAAERTDKVERRAYISSRRRGFLTHLLFFTVVMGIAFVAAVELNDPGGRGMFLAWFCAWGIGLMVHGVDVLWTRGEKFQADFSKWRINRRARELAEAEMRRLSSRR